MIDEADKKKIIELIKQGKSNYRIWKITGHVVNSIDKIRKKIIENNQAPEEDVPYTNPIDKCRGIIANFESFVKTEQLNDRERKKLEKLLKEMKEILRVEVDDRISSKRADAVEKRDQEWNKFIEQNYVKKEVATGLENTIQERERPSRVSGM